MAAPSPGRSPRGTERRHALIEAAADLVLEHGFTALTHRAVAGRAGLPLASTTYYFATLDDLRDDALRRIADVWTTRAIAAVDALPLQLGAAQVATGVAAIIGTDAPPEQLIVLYERYLEAARHERLRPLVQSWNGRLRELVHVLLSRASLPADEPTARLLLTVADGAAVTAVAEGDDPTAAVTTTLRRILDALAPDAA